MILRLCLRNNQQIFHRLTRFIFLMLVVLSSSLAHFISTNIPTTEWPNYLRKPNVVIFPIEMPCGGDARARSRQRTVQLNPRNYDARTRPEGSNQFIGLIRLPNRFPREIIRVAFFYKPRTTRFAFSSRLGSTVRVRL